ncbi:hypothetical protein F4677DRAFT_441754 [Hypoxylon crocopeplum]|nr:hypothetical protein F4677DRAFT_441754 [Hypoxylon crocopeplum]
MSGEQEPRRSVRATKGQHTKTFDQLENGPEPTKRRQSKKGSKKVVEKDEKQEDEEIIRCICGATTQDDGDTNEPWIACDKCGAWQHNVCMGMSVFTEDLTRDYFCEQCAPEDHKSTLDSMKRGEKPWEDRRHRYEEEEKKQQRKKGGRKGKGKRVSDSKERASPSAANTKAKPSPTPDAKKEEPTPEPPAVKGKRKPGDHSQGPQSKLRKVAETQAVPETSGYTPPNDLPESIQGLEGSRRQAALGLQKSLDAAVDLTDKKKLYAIPPGSTKKGITERLAIEIERAFQDTHPNTSHNASQLRTLIFSLKNNVELASQVLNGSLPPPSFVVMTGDELATKELQRETAEMKARAEKQSILITDDISRVRRTHKGEELVEADYVAVQAEEEPSALYRKAARAASEAGKAAKEAASSPAGKAASPTNASDRSGSAAGPLRVDTKEPLQSPKKSDFDISKVFSSVRSPSVSHQQRRASTQVQSAGPGDDPDVDRLLQEDGNDSPPYSPSENIDPSIVWRGPLVMTNVAELDMVAKYVGGADLSKVRGIAWKDLIPPLLTVCGRINEAKAIPYLCGLRYNNQVDLVITGLSPARPTDPDARKQFQAVIDYFQSKERYGVVGEKKLCNVRDTYLVPVLEGDGPIPEPMQNISDHLIPRNRTEPMLLMIFVYRDEKQMQIPMDQQLSELQQAASATFVQGTPMAPRPSISGPAWSPATPQAPFGGHQSIPPPQYSQTPVPLPRIPGHPAPPSQVPSAAALATAPAPAVPAVPAVAQDPTVPALRAAQAEGELKARQVLGPLFSSSTVAFLLPHAARMKVGEWTAVRRVLERDSRARDDLQLLSKLLTEEGNSNRKNGPQTNTVSSGVQNTLAAAANEGSAPVTQTGT